MKVSHPLSPRRARRFNNQGLTLIELLVVLVILIALAGILIPQLPNMLTRAHTSACATNLPEANKRIQEFEQIYFKQPANFDNLVNGTALVDYLPGTGLTAAPLTLATKKALANAGITSLAGLYDTKVHLDAAGGTPTFNPYDVTADLDLTLPAGTPSVATLSATDVNDMLRQDTAAIDGDYVALGIGQKSELVGRTLNEAPYHYAGEANLGPQDVYARYVAVYKVSEGGVAFDKAIFIGVLALSDDGFCNVSEDVGKFFNANKL